MRVLESHELEQVSGGTFGLLGGLLSLFGWGSCGGCTPPPPPPPPSCGC